MRPLHVLVFLLPLLAVYEWGILRGWASPTLLEARRVLGGLFANFGEMGIHLPAAALVVVLVVWHVLNRDAWRVRVRVVGGMYAESAVLTLPLLVAMPLIGDAAMSALAAGGAETVRGRAMLAIGAGIYEEMLFRLIGIAAVHAVAADLIGLGERWAKPLAVVVTALAFAAFHPAAGSDWRAGVQYFVAGCYFGALFVFRGLGIAVGAHVGYDLFVLLLIDADNAVGGG